MYSIGKDFRGYETWAIEITNQKTGPASEKPAFYADGNIDADEPSATEVDLYLAHRLLTQYGADPAITKLLDTTASTSSRRATPACRTSTSRARPADLKRRTFSSRR